MIVRQFYFFIKDNLGWVSTPVTLFILQFLIGGIPHLPQFFMYVSLVLSALYLLLDKNVRFDNRWLLFLIYIPFTIILANPDPIFNSPLRYVLFATLMISASSLLNSERARMFRRKCLNLIGIFASIISSGSFFCYFLGINFFKNRYDEGYYDVSLVGRFSGLTTHSMYLGPLAGLAMVFLFYYASVKRKKVLWPLIICCAGSAFFSASRGAIIAAVAGFLMVLYYTAKSKNDFINKIIRLVILLVLVFPLWGGALNGVISKQNSRIDEAGVFDSRTEKVEARISEFQNSPIYGVGFSAIDRKGVDKCLSNGTIEPGSSWLAILSQTGIVGLMIVLMLFKKSFDNCRYSMDSYRVCLLGMLVFFSVHMLVEGYIFAGGNPITFMAWLVVGNCYDCFYRVG